MPQSIRRPTLTIAAEHEFADQRRDRPSDAPAPALDDSGLSPPIGTSWTPMKPPSPAIRKAIAATVGRQHAETVAVGPGRWARCPTADRLRTERRRKMIGGLAHSVAITDAAPIHLRFAAARPDAGSGAAPGSLHRSAVA